MEKDNILELTTEGRIAVHVTADGPILHYTYPDQDNNIPEGFRRVSYLERLDEDDGFSIEPEQSKVNCGPLSDPIDTTGDKTMTIDLEYNKIPLGLLSEEEQEHLRNWPHGLRVLGTSIVGRPIWHRADHTSKLSATSVYRTIPAPIEPERETRWLYSGKSGFAFRIEFDAETGDNPTIERESFDE